MSDAMNTIPVGVTVIEALVIVTSLTILFYGFLRGVYRQHSGLPTGAVIVGAGLIIVVIAHSLDFYGRLATPAAVGQLPDIGSAGWFAWILLRIAFFMISVGLVMAIVNRHRVEQDLATSRNALKDLEANQRSSDMRFQYLFNSTSNSMYSYEFDPALPTQLPVAQQVNRSLSATLKQCNRVFARELGGNKPADVIGQPWSELESSKDRAAHEKMFRDFVANDYRISNYPLIFKTRSGVDRAVNVNMVGLVSDGRLERIWAVESNALEYQQAQEELRRQQNFQQLVARISSRLVKATDSGSDQAVESCMAELCAYLQADRSLLFWVDDDETVQLEYRFSRIGKAFSGGQLAKLFPKFWAQAINQETVRVDDTSALGEGFATDKQTLDAHGVTGLLLMPLVIGQRTSGVLAVTRVNAAVPWHDQDISDMRVIGELLANFVLRLRSRRALRDALQGLQRATDRIEAENVYLREEIELKHGFDGIVGESHGVMRSLQLVEQVADTVTPVLVLGETGTGKELIARAIHELSDRRDRPLVKVNCAALPANLIESELFGHEKGAFTGADSRKRGRFDLADESTLFLDEIGEIPIELQAKLLRVLQEGEFERLGGTKTLRVNTRIIAATNRNLSQAVGQGEFRSDLFYRINTFPIELPPLRERGNDIELLARHFVGLHGQRLGREVTEISAQMMHQLRRYNWPGNVRELDGIVQRALIASEGPVLELAEPLVMASQEPRIISSTIPELKLVERDHIVSVLEDADWKISGPDGAATLLGMPPSTLRSKMKKLGIERPN